MAQERIQKVLAEQGLCSRRAAEQIIREGRVKVNGHPVTLGDKMDPHQDILSVDGQRIYIQRKREFYYYMLNKPRGFVTTTSDELGRKTVMDLMEGVPARVFPVGRLDRDSEGLLLLTNDGDFANLMMHPSHGVSKLYRVTVRPRATEEQVVALSQGVELDDGTRTQPAVINVVTDEPERTVLEMTIREGKNREIRRMCEAVGLDVIRLRRNATERLGCDETLFVKVVKASFGQRRKMIRNSLKSVFGDFGGAEHPFFTRRAEQLGVAEFVELTNWVSRFSIL